MIVYLDNIRGNMIEIIMSKYLKNPHCMVCFNKMEEIKLQLPNSSLPMCSDECYQVILPKGGK